MIGRERPAAQHAWAYIVAIALALAAGAPAHGQSPMPVDELRSYDAASRNTPETLGDMMLSRHSASFTRLSGHMQLRHAGRRAGASAGEFDFTGEIFEVMNADQFFAANRGRNGFCPEPVRWLTVLDLSNRVVNGANLGIKGGSRVGMLTIADWRNYDPARLGACSADTFKLRSR